MKKSLLFLVLVLSGITTVAARDFSYTYEGQTVEYTVIDEYAKTCATKEGNSSDPNYPLHNVQGELIIPEQAFDGTDYYSVITIGASSFQCCNDLTSVIIPNSVTTIDNCAFEYCEGLTSITIPNSVTYIASDSFWNCTNLLSIDVEPGNIKYTSVNGVLFNNDETELLRYPCGLTGSYEIPSSVRIISVYAFSHSHGLTSVTIPNSVTTIQGSAFFWCFNLTSVTIPSSVTNIWGQTFESCDRLVSIEVEPENTKYSSYNGVLFNKDQTTLLEYPNGREGGYEIPETVKTIGGNAFYNCNDLSSISIPESVINIEDAAFWGCYGLTSVKIPNSVTNIGHSAFSNCLLLKSVSIGKSVKSIGSRAFYRDGIINDLTDVECLMCEPCEAPENIFDSSAYETATLRVPKGLMPVYKATSPWNLFVNNNDTAGVEDIVAEDIDNDTIDYNEPYVVYNINGAKVANSINNLSTGIYVVRQGKKTVKIAIQ